jgi:FxsC-like protein
MKTHAAYASSVAPILGAPRAETTYIPAMTSWFFFSYARDDRDKDLDKFYADLCREITFVKKMERDRVGFFDQRDIQLSDQWKERLREALRTCRVFVSICTPNYFASEYCGKEFQICLDRQASSGNTSTAMVSVIWGDPKGSVHPAIKKFQYTHASLPDVYAKEGLRQMVRLGVHRDRYRKFVASLARAIVDLGKNYPLPEPAALDPIERVRNAFRKAVKKAAFAPTVVRRSANFSYVVGGSHEISGVPKRLLGALAERYGPAGRDWKPFYPDYDDTVADLAMNATKRQKLDYKELPLDKNLLKRIAAAEAKRQIVVLLVDPLTMTTHRRLMQTYDRRNFDNCAVLVTWNSLLRTRPEKKDFAKGLADTFKFRAKQYQKSVYYVDSISTDKDLRSTLAQTLTKLQANLIQNSNRQQGIKQPKLTRKARLQGIELRRQPIVTGPGERRR